MTYNIGDKIDGFEIDGIGRADHRGLPATRFDLTTADGTSVGRVVLVNEVVKTAQATASASHDGPGQGPWGRLFHDFLESTKDLGDDEAYMEAVNLRDALEGFINDAPSTITTLERAKYEGFQDPLEDGEKPKAVLKVLAKDLPDLPVGIELSLNGEWRAVQSVVVNPATDEVYVYLVGQEDEDPETFGPKDIVATRR